MGHSFYYEQFRPYLEHFKNLELRGKSFAPFNIQADGVGLANYVMTGEVEVLHLHRNMALLHFGTRHVPPITAKGLFITNLLLPQLEGSESKITVLECQALMNQFLSMFLQFVTGLTAEPKPPPDAKYSQVGTIPNELIQAVAASMAEWQEISVAEHLGEVAFRSAEWIPFDESFFF
jgi:hypothetical protein